MFGRAIRTRLPEMNATQDSPVRKNDNEESKRKMKQNADGHSKPIDLIREVIVLLKRD